MLVTDPSNYDRTCELVKSCSNTFIILVQDHILRSDIIRIKVLDDLDSVVEEREIEVNEKALAEALEEADGVLEDFREENPLFGLSESEGLIEHQWDGQETLLAAPVAYVTQSGSEQSGEQSGNEIVALTAAEQLGQLLATEEEVEEAQSGDEGEEAQSGEVEIEEVETFTIFYTPAEFLSEKATQEDVDTLLEWLPLFEGQVAALVEAEDVQIVATYRAAYEQAYEGYESAGEKLDAKITAAEKLLTETEGKVADNKTRDELQAAIKAAKEVAAIEAEGVLTPVEESTQEKLDAIPPLEAAMKTVTASRDKKTADDAAAAAEAARKAAAQRQSSGYSKTGSRGNSGGSWSGNSGGSSGGSWNNSGGGSKPSGGNSGGSTWFKCPSGNYGFASHGDTCESVDASIKYCKEHPEVCN